MNTDRWKRRSVLGFGSAALGAAVVGCEPRSQAQGGQGQQQPQQPAAGTAQKGGQVVLGNIGDAKTMSPILVQDTASRAFIELHYNAPLLRRDPETLDLDTKFGTAESFNVSSDGLTVTFKLKKNIQWSDGKPITSADYKFTWDKLMDPKVDYPYRSNLSDFKGLEAPDPQTLIFTLKEPFCPAVNYLTFDPIPMHVFEGVEVNDNPMNQKPTVGSGPWLLQEWVKDSHAVFKANEKFYLGRPNLDQVVYKIVPDQNVLFSMAKTGDVDQTTFKAEDWEEAKKIQNLQLFNYYPASASWVYIGFNLRNDMLNDVRVRQAFSHAVDRQKLIERIRFGHAKPLYSIFASASWAATNDVPKFAFDLQKANQLLDAAGWKRPAGDANATRVKDGKPLKMRIFFNAGNKEREQIATVAQQNFKQIGADVEVVSEEWNAYLNRVTKTYDMEMFVLGWSSGLEPHSTGNIWKTGGGQNSTGYSNPKVDELFPKAATVPACSQAERKKIYADIQKAISADQPYIFLWENEILSGLNNRIVPNKITKLGYDYRMWEWYSKTGK